MHKFILLEGKDGAGKTSCALEMASQIGGEYYKTPPQIFAECRRYIYLDGNPNLSFYYNLAAVLYASAEIASLLKTAPVVCDRYIYTTIAYHKALGAIIPENLDKSILMPDYCFCLWAREDVIRKRIAEKKEPSTYDTDWALQEAADINFRSFGLKIFDNSDLSVKESSRIMLSSIEL